ncbi:TPA: restriction endonuclease subunit S [Escherichia coli]|uniref:Restriction endonuclease subunit S n=4 Tax=Escherichia coli TaxID=562 RepID=A0A4Y8GXC6_ECOLX|nr:restriction endonuclease subunit S [Escherichia coli]EFH9396020.1 restriction endonuclease subunit S [Escherichia coli]EFN4640363.1 restriction endonuclease subunit S [Escherichia coli]EFN5654372.1 restriction endonuclease subunit S [Escherichia coli]EGM8304086.1 restriction endonuclease subunit S [Escherichia coli]EHZ4778447.1 restriction endonuclease subunit S [Escherichia coli]
MSELSYLEKLLDGVEVEWKTLEDISIKISSGGTPKTGVSEFYDGDIPWLRTQEVNFCDIWDTEVKITESGVKNSSAKWIPKNCVIVAMYGATVGKIGINKIPMTTNQACANIQLNEEVAHYRYVFHFLCSQYTYIKSLGTGSQTNINAQIVKNIKIPIPCPDNPEKSLAIQSEIVRILDKFTELTAELTAELNMRKKQYNYYRDQLLSFKEGEVEWKALEEVSDIYDSLHQTPQYSKNGLSMIRVTDIKNGYIDLKNTLKVNDGIFSIFTKKYLPQKNDLVMSRVGSYGNVGIIPTDNSACMGQNTVVIHPHINNRYLFYILTSSIGQDFIEKNVGGGSQKTLSLKSIKSIPIPLTGESEQSKIVSILDKFDTLTNSITEGLPREIELRQKQYEYYRDLLFSFPKPETVSN